MLSLLLFSVFVGYVAFVSVRHLLLGSDLVHGWTSLMAAITIFGTIQLLLLGVMGEYLGRIYEQVKQLPLYILEEVRRVGTEDETARVSVGADERTTGAGGQGESWAP